MIDSKLKRRPRNCYLYRMLATMLRNPRLEYNTGLSHLQLTGGGIGIGISSLLLAASAGNIAPLPRAHVSGLTDLPSSPPALALLGFVALLALLVRSQSCHPSGPASRLKIMTRTAGRIRTAKKPPVLPTPESIAKPSR